MVRQALLAMSFFATLVLSHAPCQAQADGSYRLDVQDKLRLRVIDWRAAVGDANEWKSLSGEFVINSAGYLSLPLIGEVFARNETTSRLSALISERLQAKVGLSQRPDASIEVIEYRPFYVLGTVATPGAFPYRPQLTPLQALSIAGGLLRSASTGGGLEREALTSRGEVRLLSVDQLMLRLKQARLEAELMSAQQVTFPPEIAARASDPDVSRLVREEQLLFETRRETVQSQNASLNSTKVVLSQEIEFLQAKGASLERQYQLAKKELENINSLAARGLAVSGRQLSSEQSTAQFDTSRLEVSVAVLRAKQDLGRADREIAELRGKARADTLVTLNEVRSKLASVNEKLATTRALVANTEAYSPELDVPTDEGVTRSPVFRVTRVVDGTSRSFDIAETDMLLPGDVLSVSRGRSAPPAKGIDVTLR